MNIIHILDSHCHPLLLPVRSLLLHIPLSNLGLLRGEAELAFDAFYKSVSCVKVEICTGMTAGVGGRGEGGVVVLVDVEGEPLNRVGG
jgi:hypothetical protein